MLDKLPDTVPTLGFSALDEYSPLIGEAAVERIQRKADKLATPHVVHISSTFYGGGVSAKRRR